MTAYFQDIIQNARELQQSEDEIVVIERDLEDCKIKLGEEDDVIRTLEGILARVEVLNRPDASLEMGYEVLRDLKVMMMMRLIKSLSDN